MMTNKAKGSSINSIDLASRDETENSIESRLSELDKEKLKSYQELLKRMAPLTLQTSQRENGLR